jgi:hypothetical protein
VRARYVGGLLSFAFQTSGCCAGLFLERQVLVGRDSSSRRGVYKWVGSCPSKL